MIRISNQEVRLLWLTSHGLNKTVDEELNLLQIIKDLGFVQLDSIQNVTRAHHHILWSRNKAYKEHMLDDLLMCKGAIFEHFTHDASVLPVAFYPMWKGQFHRYKQKLDQSKYYKDILDEKGIQNILDRIKKEGPLNTKDFQSTKKVEQKMWHRPAHKSTLDYLWYGGILSTAYRKNFRKYYDLIENVIPSDILKKELSLEEQIDWLCSQALHKMSLASAKEIKNFWDTLSIKEVNHWIQANKENLLEIEWENNEGKYLKSFAPLDIEQRVSDLTKVNSKLQIINPFDPIIRDRKRTKAIFDFEYKIEIFVPKEKREWGYYVYPILEGSQFIGRIELKADRQKNQLYVLNFWKEKGILWNATKIKKLNEELSSFASLANVQHVKWLV